MELPDFDSLAVEAASLDLDSVTRYLGYVLVAEVEEEGESEETEEKVNDSLEVELEIELESELELEELDELDELDELAELVLAAELELPSSFCTAFPSCNASKSESAWFCLPLTFPFSASIDCQDPDWFEYTYLSPVE